MKSECKNDELHHRNHKMNEIEHSCWHDLKRHTQKSCVCLNECVPTANACILLLISMLNAFHKLQVPKRVCMCASAV